MLKLKCNVCNKELEELGALCFSPPNEKSTVKKYHVCKKCWEMIYTLHFDDYGDLDICEVKNG